MMNDERIARSLREGPPFKRPYVPLDLNLGGDLQHVGTANSPTAWAWPGRRQLLAFAALVLLLTAITAAVVTIGSLLRNDEPRLPETGTYHDWQPAAFSVPDGNEVSEGVNLVRFDDQYFAISPPNIWASADGAVWTPVPTAGIQGVAFDVAADDAHIVAVGEASQRGEPATVWLSSDGGNWQRITDAPAFETITALPHGFLAIRGTDTGSEIWTSADGSAWSRVVSQTELEHGSIAGLRVVRPANGEPIAVAVGATQSRSGNYKPQIWYAPVSDLGQWQAWSTFDQNNEFVGMRDVAQYGGRIVAVGMRGYCCRFEAYTSADGAAWDRLASPLSDEPGIAPDVLVATPSGYVLLGFRGGEVDRQFTLWTSPDALNWEQVSPASGGPSDRFVFNDALIGDDGALIVVGTDRGTLGKLVVSAWIVR